MRILFETDTQRTVINVFVYLFLDQVTCVNVTAQTLHVMELSPGGNLLSNEEMVRDLNLPQQSSMNSFEEKPGIKYV